MRVAVVGASSGLGRCLAEGLARAGEQVALLARRKDLVDSAVTEADNGTVAVPCDTTDESSVTTAVTTAVGALSGVYGLPHVKQCGNTEMFLSSNSASMTAPRPGLVPYLGANAALDELVEAWGSEHPDVGFTRVAGGERVGGECVGAPQLKADWDPGLAGRLLPVWSVHGLLSPSCMDVDDLVDAMARVLRPGASASVPSIAVPPRQPAL